MRLATDEELLGWHSTSGDLFDRVYNCSREHRVDDQIFQGFHQHVEPGFGARCVRHVREREGVEEEAEPPVSDLKPL